MANTKWVIDPAHSEIGFKVKHMMFTNVSGKLQNFNVLMETNVDIFENAKVEFDGAIDSLTTNNSDRDAHLLGPDFFDAGQFPLVTFEATSFKRQDEVNYKLTGDLTLRGITKQVTFDTEFSGLLKDPWGVIKAGFIISGKINRKEWGLTYNSALDGGGVLIGDEVRLDIDLQFIKQ
jgi:polyisoprenoid-binding protein YceI